MSESDRAPAFNWPGDLGLAHSQLEGKPRFLENVLRASDFRQRDLEEALWHSANSSAPFSLRLDGNVLPVDSYSRLFWQPFARESTPAIDTQRVEELLRRGALLKIPQFANVSSKVERLVRQARERFRVVVSSNGYLSCRADRGLDLHWDTHDVLAVQLMGKKRWRLYSPTIELPTKAQRSRDFIAPDPDRPALEVTLAEGDALLVPRGWWHLATPVQGEMTLHVAIGLFPPTNADLLLWLLARSANENVEMRRAVPRTGPTEADLASLREVLDTPPSPESIAAFWQEYDARVEQPSTMRLDGV